MKDEHAANETCLLPAVDAVRAVCVEAFLRAYQLAGKLGAEEVISLLSSEMARTRECDPGRVDALVAELTPPEAIAMEFRAEAAAITSAMGTVLRHAILTSLRQSVSRTGGKCFLPGEAQWRYLDPEWLHEQATTHARKCVILMGSRGIAIPGAKAFTRHDSCSVGQEYSGEFVTDWIEDEAGNCVQYVGDVSIGGIVVGKRRHYDLPLRPLKLIPFEHMPAVAALLKALANAYEPVAHLE